MKNTPAGLLAAAVAAVWALATAPLPAQTPASRPARIKVTIGRETTYVTGPLNRDGTVNYVAALNAICGKGVTRDNNAVVLLARAIGPAPFDKQTRSATLKALGLADLPEKGNYFIDLPPSIDRDDYSDPAQAARDRFQKAHARAETQPANQEDEQELAAWIKANQTPLALAVEASCRSRFFSPWPSIGDPPTLYDSLNKNFPLFAARHLCQALVIRANLRARGGDFGEAMQDLLAVHRLARLTGQSPMLIDALVAMSCDMYATRGELAMVRGGKLPAPVARRYLADLATLPPLPPLADTFDCGERLFELDYFTRMVRIGLEKALREYEIPGMKPKENVTLPDLSLDLDELMRLANAGTDGLVRCARLPTYPQRKKAFDDLEKSHTLLEPVQEIHRRNDMSLLSGTLLKNFKEVIDKVGTRDPKRLARAVYELLSTDAMTVRVFDLAAGRATEARLSQLALALWVYRQEKGQYPDRLDALVPGVLKAIPNDLFTEQPPRYQRKGKGYLLYGLGENMKDDGGKKESAERDGRVDWPKDDVAIEME